MEGLGRQDTWLGSGFLENLFSFFRMHWDHEPLAVPRPTESADKSDALQTLRARGRVNGPRASVWSACVFSAAFPRQAAIRWPVRVMESLRDFDAVRWDHGPTPDPSQEGN